MAQTGGQRQRVHALALINIDVVKADGFLANLNLARLGRGQVFFYHLHDRLGTEGLDFDYFGFGQCLRSILLWQEIRPAMQAMPLASLAGLSAFYRSEEHTSELQSIMRSSYAVFCL